MAEVQNFINTVTKIVRYLVLYLVGAFWGLAVCLQMLRLLFTKPRKFLSWRSRPRPSVLDDPLLGNHGYARVNGQRIHYVASGSASKPLMLLLHGFPEFWYSWRHQIKEFNKDYRVVAVDLRGYSESDAPSAVSEYTVDILVEDIKQLIPSLGYTVGYIIGHDWGGAITWAMSQKYPELITKAVILNCPHPGAMSRYMATHWGQFIKSWYMFFVNLPYLPEWFFTSGDKKMLENAFVGKYMGAKLGSYTTQDIEAYKYTFQTPGKFTGPMNYIRAALRYSPLRPAVNMIENVPLLLIWGTNDGALCQDMAELSRKYAKQFTLKFIEGASHWVQQDEPNLVNKYIKEHLS